MARLRKAPTHDSSDPPVGRRSTTNASLKPGTTSDRNLAENTASDHSSAEETEARRTAKQKNAPSATKIRAQIRLAPLKSLQSLSSLTVQDDTPEKARRKGQELSRPRQLLQKTASPKKEKTTRTLSPDLVIPSGGPADDTDQVESDSNQPLTEEAVDVEESIWCGPDASSSDSESDHTCPSAFFLGRRKPNTDAVTDLSKQLKVLSCLDDDDDDDDEAPRSRIPFMPSHKQPPTLVSPGSSSDKENLDAILRFSPPRFKRPLVEKGSPERPSTPPQTPPSPSKGKLLSPSKNKSPVKTTSRLPTPPLRPSLDAFWTADTVNDWLDQFSPQKPLRSPRKLFISQPPVLRDDDDSTPVVSPRKLLQSPSKRSKVEIQGRKDWDIRKLTLAEQFLQELDETITSNEIAELSASTGGVQIVWSRTLNSTAGRANWRRETTKSCSKADPTETTTVHKHFASIELAEKVLTYSEDCEVKLLNVIAHEFCHLANFMVSEIKDQPHGASFKQWGVKCSRRFADRGIHVTTKHSYEIEYKYIWKCEDDECGMEFKRHSKSINPKRHRCGQCRGALVQIKPAPRGLGKSVSGTATPRDITMVPAVTGFAAYVKIHFANLKKTMPGTTHKEVMEALGRMYRAEKAMKLNAVQTLDIDDVAKKLGGVRLDVHEIINLD